MGGIRFGTKAETLENLRRSLTFARVKPSETFTHAEWKRDAGGVMARIAQKFPEQILFVRSSAVGEDGVESSHAGEFDSVGGVPSGDEKLLCAAVGSVFASYGRDNPSDQCFVQEHIQFIKMAGVIFTRSKDTLAPYYVINYDETGSHDSVTSGAAGNLKTYYRFRGSPNEGLSYDLRKIVSAAEEIETLFGNDSLDIEFAITEDDELFILQVRPIVKNGKAAVCTDERMKDYLTKIHFKLRKLNAPHPGLFGKKALYSIMTDWNPAEMIGVRPRALALSLYKELITDNVWAYQRRSYGYRDMRSFPLLVSFLGCPYIDVRASFNSFVPAELDPALAGKLVDYYLEQLAQSPADHDKVEFNILFSCYYLNVAQKLKRLLNFGFSELEVDRIKFALLSLTNRIVGGEDETFHDDLRRVETLEARYAEVMASELPTIDKIYWLVEDCKRYGTLPFAGLARAGFIAVQFLRSMVELRIISQDEMSRFMNSLNTVAKQLANDTQKFFTGELPKEEFMARYGHLRPGTYDILSKRYDEAPELYFQDAPAQAAAHEGAAFELLPAQTEKLRKLLVENGIRVDVPEFMRFLAKAIEGREYGKFVFTKNLSTILVLVEKLGNRCGVSREEMSHVSIKTILEMYSKLEHHDVKDVLETDIARNKESNLVAQSIELPQLITSENDIYDFLTTHVEPNYITREEVTNIVVVEEDFPNVELNGRIAFIRSADPGYDWVFSRNIAGLVTMYGGVNSHMAIRCAELKIPAVIGCGEQNFSKWSRAKTLQIDCANRKVVVVS